MAFEILDAPFDQPTERAVVPVSANTRFINYIIDVLLFYFFMFFIGTIAAEFGLFQWLGENTLIDRLFSMVLYGLFMAVQEIVLGGRSIGKFITGTKVVDTDGHAPNTKTLFLRNLYRAVPFDQLTYFGSGRGWHDQWSDTYVVKI